MKRPASVRPKKEPASPARRDWILESARGLFARMPFHEVLLEHVAESAGVAKGTIYTYFSSKEDLLIRLIQDDLQSLIADLARISQEPSCPADESLRQMLLAMVRFCRSHRTFLHLFRSSQGQIKEKCREEGDQIFGILAAILERGLKERLFVPHRPEWIAYLIGGGLGELLVAGVEESVRSEDLVDEVCRIVLQGLQSPPRKR